MRDLLESLDRIIEAPRGEKGGGDASNIRAKPKPEDPRTVTNKKFGSIGDFIKAVRTPGQQGGSTAAQTSANLAKAAAPAPAVATPTPAPAPKMAMPKSPPPRPAKLANVPAGTTPIQTGGRGGEFATTRPKVAATAANTKDFDKTMALQKRLQAQGANIKADGIMGPNTRAAMQQFGGGKPAAPAPAAPTQVASPGPRGRNRPRNRPAPAEPTPARGGVLARIGAGIGDFSGGRASAGGQGPRRNRRGNRATV